MSDNKVTADHLRRTACLYVRQSSMRQVVENQESTKRQYSLKKKALDIGWREDQIEVIDDDQGLSGTSAQERKGFQRLVVDVSMGKVGLVMGLEVSRLARDNADWQQLLKICVLTDTLILDEDGLYDPCSFNDKLVLGIKGFMSEVESHIIRARMQGGRLNKAKRCELKMNLPIGYVHDNSGKLVIDPNKQVREIVSYLFSTFKSKGTAYAVFRDFYEKELLFPVRILGGPNDGELLWKPLRYHKVLNILHNPIYAGAYVYGRTKGRRNPVSGKREIRRVPQEKWEILLHDIHEGYISWVQYQQNQMQLAENAAANNNDCCKHPPREGPALLQGMVICGKCGKRMSVRYYNSGNTKASGYFCRSDAMRNGSDICQYIPGASVDECISRLLLERLTSTSLEVSMQVFKEIQRRREEIIEVHRTNLEHARHEAEMARRWYFSVEPDNRLVADELEIRWNDALEVVKKLEEKFKAVTSEQTSTLTKEDKMLIRQLAEDFPSVWDDPQTSAKDRKRMVRLLIEDVTLIRSDKVYVKIRFKGGYTKELCLPKPLRSWEKRQTDPTVIELIIKLAYTMTDKEIAQEFNLKGFRTGTGLSFTGRKVCILRHNYNIPGLYDHFRKKGFLKTDELAKRFGVCSATVRKWRRDGTLKGRQCNDKDFLYEDPGDDVMAILMTRKIFFTRPIVNSNIMEQIRKMARTMTDRVIAEKLDRQYSGSEANALTGYLVYRLRRNYDIPGPYVHFRKMGLLTPDELTKHLGVGKRTLKKWWKAGILKAHRYNDRNELLYEVPDEDMLVKLSKKKGISLSMMNEVVENTKEM